MHHIASEVIGLPSGSRTTKEEASVSSGACELETTCHAKTHRVFFLKDG
jgi:hypothetical protein